MAAEKEKKVMDVAGPEDAKANIGAKPMIVGHKSMAADPMVRDNTEKEKQESPTSETQETVEQEKPAESKIEPPSSKQKTIQPLSEEKAPDQQAEKVTEDKSEQQQKDENTEPEAKTDEDGKKIDPAAEAMEREETIRKIIESKKYNVSIKQAKGSSKGLVWVLVGLLLAGLLGLFVLIDAGRLDVGFKLPFSIFGNNQDNATNSSTTQDSSTDTTQQTETAKSNIAKPTEYSIDFPEQLAYSREVETIDGVKYFKDTYELPLGVKVVVEKDSGGKGGTCEPAESDVPHQSGNACPTLEYLKKEKIDISPKTAESLLYSDNPFIYLTNKKITGTDGVSTFEACLETFDPQFNLEVGEPYMGAVFSGCAGGVVTKQYSLIISVENVDPNNLFNETGVVDNDGLTIAETALMSFELL